MHRHHLLLPAAVASLLYAAAACGSSGPSATAPDPTFDAGTSVHDAGTTSHPDAAPAPTPDAGPLPEAGTVVPGGPRYVGRVDLSNPNAPKLAWTASGVVATVTGASISVKLTSEGSESFYQPVIDGAAGARFSVAEGATQTVSLGTNLGAGDHTVEIYRDTEGMYGDTIFGGFVDGTVKGAPAPRGRLLEIIGDSISAGYGNLGMEVHPPWDNTCTWSLDTQAGYQAYSALLARNLGADVSIIARSGWGMVRDNTGDASGVLSSVYGNTVGTEPSPTWSFQQKPDAVLINLGTNDAVTGDPGQAYEDAYVAFLKTVRGHYPDAWIFLTMGTITSDPMLTTMRTHIANVVTTYADAKVVKLDMDVQDSTSTGCDYHPNVPEDITMATTLTASMRTYLGW